jgi:hypothetical protein
MLSPAQEVCYGSEGVEGGTGAALPSRITSRPARTRISLSACDVRVRPMKEAS